MKHRIAFINLPLLAVFLVLASTAALASNTWYVDGVHGSNNNNCKSPQHACKTIGHAQSLAHSGDSIMVAAATYTEGLSIGISLKILGSGAKTTIIDGGGKTRVATISGTSTHVTLSQLTIRNGFAANGGGIFNSGTLTVIKSTLIGNKASGANSAEASGGGIYNNGTLTVVKSTLGGNRAIKSCFSGCGAFGGGIYSSGRLTISNSTLSGNGAGAVCRLFCRGAGGGILNTGTLTINNSTLSGNGAAPGYAGGNIAGRATLQNSIVANSSSGGNCAATMTSNGYNLSSDGTCNFNNTGDLNNTDPKLGQLGNYGGPTQTIPLLSGSPAIDAGNPSGCTDGHGRLLKTDQRGKPRPDREDKSGCDMGAFERQSD